MFNIYTNILLQVPLLPTDSIASEKVDKISQEMAELKSLSLEDLINRLAESAVNFAINLAIAILVFYAGRFIIRKIYRIVKSIFLRREIDKSLSTFILSLLNMVLYFILIVTVIGILGIETTSFLALFASAGVAIGMALSGTLQNFAGGVLILLLKPYKIGDYIEVQGYAGTVKEIQIFFTVITTYDNKSISIPNGGLSTGSVNNWTREQYRRVQWDVAISYGDSVELARNAVLEMFSQDSRIMDATPAICEPGDSDNDTQPCTTEADAPAEAEPQKRPSLWHRLIHHHRRAQEAIAAREEQREAAIAALTPKPDYSPRVYVKELADSSVNLSIRCWTKTADYWPVYFEYNEKFYSNLPKSGIHFPFPQLDVHLQS